MRSWSRFFVVIAGIARGDGRKRPDVPAISTRVAKPREPNRDGRNRSGHDTLITAALILFAAFILSACVGGHTQLVSGSKLFGDQFQLNLYQEFIDGKSISTKTAVFRWNGTRYELVSGDASGVKFFRAEALGKNDLLVETTDDKDYVYFLAHKLAEATYRFVPVNENNLGKAEQKRLCVMQDRDSCTIETRAQLDTFVRASIGKAGPLTMVAVLSAAAN
ncbi:MAG TPA: hypothetical protein VIY51_13860 [Xanthobacteraceae bacterium]